MHKSSGRWQLGLSLALVTTILWGLLPIALDALLKKMDPWTITFYRFFGAALVIGLYLFAKNKLPQRSLLNKRLVILFSIATITLCANYVFFIMGLNLAKPATTQVMIQLAPMILLFGGLVIFKETFSRLQWIGFIIFFIGLLLFFNHRITQLFTARGDYSTGVFYIFIAAITWAIYALIQKQLLQYFSGLAIIFIILTMGSLLFFPVAEITQINQLDAFHLFLLFFASMNTAIAYGAFAEALQHWEASRVSAVLSLTPIITVTLLHVLSNHYPQWFQSEALSQLTILGMLVVVLGSMLTALGRAKAKSKLTLEQVPLIAE